MGSLTGSLLDYRAGNHTKLPTLTEFVVDASAADQLLALTLKFQGAINDANKGRVSLKASALGVLKSNRLKQGRRDRRHQVSQIRANKKAKILEAKRSIGGTGKFAPPLLTAVINLNDYGGDITTWLISKLTDCDATSVTVTKSQTNKDVLEDGRHITHLSFPRFKRR